jgi:hypothetical protein
LAFDRSVGKQWADAAVVLKAEGSLSFRNFVLVELFEETESWLFLCFRKFAVVTCFNWLNINSWISGNMAVVTCAKFVLCVVGSG